MRAGACGCVDWLGHRKHSPGVHVGPLLKHDSLSDAIEHAEESFIYQSRGGGGGGGRMQDPLHPDKKWFWFFVLFGVGFFRIFVVVIVFLFCFFPLQIYGPKPIGLR